MVYLIKFCHTNTFSHCLETGLQIVSDLYRLALCGMYILAEALQNSISVHDESTLAVQTQVSLEKFKISYKKNN